MRRILPKRPIPRRLAAGAAALLVAAAVGLLLARDLPRRRVERALAERIGADVRLGAVSAEGLHDFILRDLEIREMASQPTLEGIRVEEIRVRGSLPAFLKGRFEALRISGLAVRLAPPPPGPPPPAAEPVQVFVDRLEVQDGEFVVAAGGAETALEFTASLTGVGGDLGGEVRLRAAEAALGPPLALASGDGKPLPIERGSVEGLEASIRISDAGRSGSLTAGARRVLLRRNGRDLEIPSPSLRVEARQAEPGAPLSFEAKPALPFVESLEAAATIDPADGTILQARVAATGIDVETAARLAALPLEGWSLRGRADGTAESVEPNRFTYELAVRLDEAAFAAAGTSLAAESSTIRAIGAVRLESGSASGPVRVDLSLPRLHGRVGGIPIPQGLLPVDATLDASVEAGAFLLGEGVLTVGAGGAGRLQARGSVRLPPSGPESDVRFTWTGLDLERIALLAREAGLGPPPGLSVRGAVTAEGMLSGKLAEPAVEGKVEVVSLRWEAMPGGQGGAAAASLSEGRASARLSWRSPAGPIEVADLALSGTATVPPLTSFPVSLAARGAVDPATFAARIDTAAIESPGLARVTASGDGRLGEDPHGALRVHAEGIDLSVWRSFLRPVVGDPAPGYTVRGTMETDLEAKVSLGGRLAGSGAASIREGGFASEDGTRVLEGLDTSWGLSFEMGTEDPAFALHARSPVGGFQLLWGGFFLDGSSLTSSLEAEIRATAGSSPEPDARGWAGRVVWTLPDGPRVEATLDLPPSGPTTGAVDLTVADLGTTVERYLRAPLEDAVPFFQRIEAGGSLRAGLRATLSKDAPTLRGRVETRGVRVAGTGGYAEVEGLDLDLPVDLAWGPPGPDGIRPLTGAPAVGSLRFSRAAAGGLEFPATATALGVLADSVGLEGGLEIPILGGTIGFARLRLVDLLRPSRRVETGILLSRLDLGEAARSLGFFPLEGTLDGQLPSVRMSPAELSVTGGGEISIFGGKVEIGDISGQDVLSRYPKLAFSASFRDIDLGRLTRRFDFGEMTGTIEGFVRDCALFRGVPVRLEAEVRTVEREGVPRTINVKAINNIAILGTGGGVNVFDRGIHRFFDKYTYEALGIRMSLENDVFLMRGLERRGDQELLLKGRLPLRIDVVNAQPGKTVSFRTMLDRFRSLDCSAATTSP